MKINFRIKSGWKEATTTEKIVGIATWLVILSIIIYLTWR
jgi:hypothetical protein|nr:MAG TPA: hypothetical protein [Caudoviricetes sp.]